MRMILALALIAPLAACATITRGTKQSFTVETEPSGAAVQTSIGHSCDATPCTFAKVPRESEFSVTVSMPGYRTTTHQVTHQTSGGGGAGMAGNILLGGVIGAAVDGNNGATQELTPNPLRVSMQREEPPMAAATPEPAPAPVAEAAPAAGVATAN